MNKAELYTTQIEAVSDHVGITSDCDTDESRDFMFWGGWLPASPAAVARSMAERDDDPWWARLARDLTNYMIDLERLGMTGRIVSLGRLLEEVGRDAFAGAPES